MSAAVLVNGLLYKIIFLLMCNILYIECATSWCVNSECGMCIYCVSKAIWSSHWYCPWPECPVGRNSFSFSLSGFQEAEALPWLQQRKESIVWMGKVLYYLPGLGPAMCVVDGLQVRELSADAALSWSHHSLEKVFVLFGAVPNLAVMFRYKRF